MKWKDKAGLKIDHEGETSPVETSLAELNRLQIERDSVHTSYEANITLRLQQLDLKRLMRDEQGVLPVLDEECKPIKRYKLY